MDLVRRSNDVVDDWQVQKDVLFADPGLPLQETELVLADTGAKGTLPASLVVGYLGICLVACWFTLAGHLGVYHGAIERIRVRHEFDGTLCYQVHVLLILGGTENDLILLEALLLEAWMQLGHV